VRGVCDVPAVRGPATPAPPRGASRARAGVRVSPPPKPTKDAADMMTTDLGACEWFVWDLRRSNLIDRGQLDQVIGEFLNKHPGAEPAALAEFLVSQNILTAFQADRLLQGKTQGF